MVRYVTDDDSQSKPPGSMGVILRLAVCRDTRPPCPPPVPRALQVPN